MSEFSQLEQRPEREEDRLKLKTQELFNALAAQYGTQTMLKYVEDQTDIVPIVTQEWLAGKRQPSSGIRKDIYHCLRNFDPKNLPAQNLNKENELKIPEPQTDQPTQPSVKKTARQLKRETIIKKNEEELQAIIERLKQKGQIID